MIGKIIDLRIPHRVVERKPMDQQQRMPLMPRRPHRQLDIANIDVLHGGGSCLGALVSKSSIRNADT